MSNKADATNMTQPTKRELKPKLRFPEFQDAGEWEKRTLGNLLNYQQPTDYLVSDTKYSNAYKTPVLTAGKTFILGYTSEQYGIYCNYLPVIIFDDFTTATQFVDFSFKAKSSAMKILQAKSGTSIKFMYEAMQMISYEVGTHERHWISKFAPMAIFVPKLSEQQKIADCLSSIDELITAQTQKLSTLKTHKKALMQQLFPTEGETLPKLRFHEFREKWNGNRFGVITDNISSGKDKSDPDGAYDLFGSTGVIGKTSSYAYDGEFILVARVGANAGLLTKVKGTFGVTDNTLVIYLKQSTSIDFVFYYLESLDLNKLTFGSGQPLITGGQLKALSLFLPDNLEQQKIADCLSSIDDLIAAQTQKLGSLKSHKKGLMQQLFPALEEVSR